MSTNTIILTLGSAPVDLDYIKQHVIIDDDITEDDPLLVSYIDAATNYAETILNRPIRDNQYKIVFSDQPGDEVFLPYGPLVSLDEVKYRDTDNAEQTFDTNNFWLDHSVSKGAKIVLKDEAEWPEISDGHPNPVEITWTIAATAQQVPEIVKYGIAVFVAQAYNYREDNEFTILKSRMNNLFAQVKTW